MNDRVDGIQCLDCKDVIWSKHVHDFVWCSCKKVAIDGGRAYKKVTFTDTPPRDGQVLLDQEGKKVGFIPCRRKKKSSS